MNTPLYTRILDYYKQNRISFAMPGHKNGRGLANELINCDVTELTYTENLHHPRQFVKESKQLLSKLFKSDESFIITGGSTAGIQAMITASLKPGQTLLAASDCHMSVINTCALLGINLRFIPKEINSEYLIPTKLKNISEYIHGVDAVIITSPTYYGLCADVKSLAEVCHMNNIPLLVDEAHGAHFTASKKFPEPAIISGADAVCQSAHKTLNALTGAAFLHIKSKLINYNRLKKALYMFQTSSPSYVIAASADTARAELEQGGWDEMCELCEEFRKRLAENTEIKILDNDDCTRLVLCFKEYEITGFEIEEMLAESYQTDVEMADLLNVVLIVTPSNTASDMEKLYLSLVSITASLKKRSKAIEIDLPPAFDGVISPHDAFFSDTKMLPLERSCGKISAVTVTSYPPGIPIIYIGAKITAEQVDYIKYLEKKGAEITGINEGCIEVVYD